MSDRPTVHEQVFGVAAPPIDTEFGRVSMERAVDGLWGRRGLEHRDRRLLTLAVVAASANDAALDAQLQQDSGITHIQYSILAMLSEAPDRSLRMTELADVTESSRSRLSHAVSIMD